MNHCGDPTPQAVGSHGAGLLELSDSAARLQHILGVMDDYVWVYEPDGTLVYLNPAARRLVGVGMDERQAGRNAWSLCSPWAATLIREEGMCCAEREGTWRGEVTMRRPDGNLVPVSLLLAADRREGQVVTFSAIAHDLSRRKAYEAELTYRAQHDELTGLPNRAMLVLRAGEALARMAKRQRSVTVVVAGIDRFQRINETLGHDAGDRLLLAVADRLQGVIRRTDVLGRLGGDQFGLVCADLSAADGEALAHDLADALERPFVVRGREVSLSLSVGVSTLRAPRSDAAALVRDAESAMYLAKRQERQVVVLDDTMRARSHERMEIETALRAAIEHDELRTHFQPKIDLESGRVTGFEALVRWHHPERGFIPPSAFIGIAEDSGLVVPMGLRMLELACIEARRWNERPDAGQPVGVSVNLSPRQFDDPALVEQIADVLSRTGARPDTLYLEITESVLVTDPAAAHLLLERLRELGVRLAIDDFGTGYSSLSTVRDFPVDMLKIDRSFVTRIHEEPRDAAVVQAIVEMAHALGLIVVAEGIEVLDQAVLLHRLGCDLGQGYLFSAARPPEEALDLLSAAVSARAAVLPLTRGNGEHDARAA